MTTAGNTTGAGRSQILTGGEQPPITLAANTATGATHTTAVASTDKNAVTGGNYSFSHSTNYDAQLKPLFDALTADQIDSKLITQLVSNLINQGSMAIDALLTQLENEWLKLPARALLQIITHIRESGKPERLNYLGQSGISHRCSYLVRDLLGDEQNNSILERLDHDKKLCRTIERNIDSDIHSVTEFAETWGSMYTGGQSDRDYSGMKWAENIRAVMRLLMVPGAGFKVAYNLFKFIRKTPGISTGGILTYAKTLINNPAVSTATKIKIGSLGTAAVGYGAYSAYDSATHAAGNYIYDKEEDMAKNDSNWSKEIAKVMKNTETPEDFATTFKEQTKRGQWKPDKEEYGLLDGALQVGISAFAGFFVGGFTAILTAIAELMYIGSSNELVDNTRSVANSINDTLGSQKETEDILFASINNALNKEDNWNWSTVTATQPANSALATHTATAQNNTTAHTQPVAQHAVDNHDGMIYNPYTNTWFTPGLRRSSLRAGISG